MEISKVGRILKVCELITHMPSGGGWVLSREIILWSSVPHATTYRYLTKMVKLEYLEVNKKGYRDTFINHYKITNLGIQYLKTLKVFDYA